MNFNNIKMCGAWILVKVDPFPEKTKSGLYRPKGNTEDVLGNTTGTIISCGPGRFSKTPKEQRVYGKHVPNSLKIGDKIMFRGYLSELIHPDKYGDTRYCVINESEVVGVLEEE